jgi:hypothetical protein
VCHSNTPEHRNVPTDTLVSRHHREWLRLTVGSVVWNYTEATHCTVKIQCLYKTGFWSKEVDTDVERSPLGPQLQPGPRDKHAQQQQHLFTFSSLPCRCPAILKKVNGSTKGYLPAEINQKTHHANSCYTSDNGSIIKTKTKRINQNIYTKFVI